VRSAVSYKQTPLNQLSEIGDRLAKYLQIYSSIFQRDFAFENLYSPQMVERTKTNNNNLKKNYMKKNTIVI